MLPDIQRRIVNAKYVLERAAKIQSESNEMSLSISLLLMHDAIELLMLAVLDHLRLTPKKRREFMDFWSDIQQSGRPEPPDFIPMESLNKLRVGLKHNGNLPNPQTVRDLLPRAKGFFENVLRAYCDTSYDDISLIDLIPHAGIRAVLAESRREFLVGSKVESLIKLKIALHGLENPEGKVLPLLQAPPKPSLPSELQRAGLGQYLDSLHSFLEQCAIRTNANLLGIDPFRYTRFMRMTPSLQWSMAGTYQAQLRGTYDEVTKDIYDEFIDFLVDYSLKVSEVYIPKTIRVTLP